MVTYVNWKKAKTAKSEKLVISQILLSPVHHRHHNHHHFHYASLHLSSTPDSKLTLSISPFHLFGRISQIFMTISGLTVISSLVFVLFFSFHLFLFDSCDRLSWFDQLLNCKLNLLNCMLNPCTFFSFLIYLKEIIYKMLIKPSFKKK